MAFRSRRTVPKAANRNTQAFAPHELLQAGQRTSLPGPGKQQPYKKHQMIAEVIAGDDTVGGKEPNPCASDQVRAARAASVGTGDCL